MNYYIYKRIGVIVGHNQTKRALPPPAISVSAEEFKRLGFYVETPAEKESPDQRVTDL